MKSIFIVLILLLTLSTNGQIKFGQPSNETLYWLTYTVSERGNWELEKRYSSGKLQSIIVSQFNQSFYDLALRLDATQLYIFEEGKYVKNLLQFPQLSLEYLQERFDSSYSADRIGKFYFDKDYKAFRTIELVDGIATIVYQQTVFEMLSEEVRHIIRDKEYQNSRSVNEEVVSPTYNAFEQSIRESFDICREKEILEVKLNDIDFDIEEDYLTYSHRTVFCNNSKDIVLDYLIEEGVNGFYYYSTSSMTFEELSQMLFESYELPFDLSDGNKQRTFNESDPKAYSTLLLETVNDLKTLKIESFYDGSPEGDYIRIKQMPDNSIQVHISYNGII